MKRDDTSKTIVVLMMVGAICSLPLVHRLNAAPHPNPDDRVITKGREPSPLDSEIGNCPPRFSWSRDRGACVRRDYIAFDCQSFREYREEGGEEEVFVEVRTSGMEDDDVLEEFDLAGICGDVTGGDDDE